MRIPIWQVDAFADRPFSGNPAAVCLLDDWLPDATLQAIAAEEHLSETAFLVPEPGAAGAGTARFALRWFTPAVEVDLCGHATLAAGHVVLRHLAPGAREVAFGSRSGPLAVARGEAGRLSMRLPRRVPAPAAPPPALVAALGRAPEAALLGRDWIAVLPAEADVRALAPDLAAVERLAPAEGLVVTAPASTPGIDFVSRCFYPGAGIPEDPVTGSAHCALAPYWAARLGKPRLEALQASRRGGRLSLEDGAGEVVLAGATIEFLRGEIEVEP